MQKRLGILGIFLIVLMFVFSSGFVFADEFKKLEIKDVSYDFDTNNLSISYSDSITPSFDNGSNFFSKNTIFSLSYEVEDTKDNINYFILYVPKKLNSSEENSVSRKISSLVYTKDISKMGDFLSYFPGTAIPSFVLDSLRSIYDEEYPSSTYSSSCSNNRENLKNEFASSLKVNSEEIYIKCGITDDGVDNFTVSFDDLKEEGTFIVVLIKYNVTRNLGPMEYSTANLIDLYKQKNKHKGIFIKDKEGLFNKNNYFAKIKYLNVNSQKNVVLPIKLKSEIKDSKVNLSVDGGISGTIYYTLDGFDLNNYFDAAFKSIKETPSSLNTFKNVENIIPQIKKYTSPVSLSSGQKLNAIAVNLNISAKSNYLKDISVASGQSSTGGSESNNFSINFKEDIKTDNVICEKETKICYVKLNQNYDVNLIVNKVNDGNVYFAINNLTRNSNASFNNPTLISNNITLGNNLVNYNSQNTEFKVNLNQNINIGYIISSKQDNTNVDNLYFVFLSDVDFNSLLEYKILQKIINDVYCPGCNIPSWLPEGLVPISSEAPKNDSDSSQNLSSDCKYTDQLKILCDFRIFNLDNNIGSTNISSSAGSFNPKETYYLEIKHYYDTRKTTFNKNIEGYKLFESEKNNFGLSENEIAIFFSIIGGESSFSNNSVGDQGESIGLAQINKPIWKTTTGYNNLKPYLPTEINTEAKYFNYFDQSQTDLNKSLYLGLAVFKYNLNFATTNINSFDSKYTNVEKAFILFYAHQFNIRDTRTFFNTVNIPGDKNNIFIDCVTDKTQKSSDKRLGCVATVGSIRKIGWYMYYLEILNK